jgi:spore coat protein U-like protein
MCGLALVPLPALAATATANMDVRVTITAECKINSGKALDFGTHGVLDAKIDDEASFNVQCTKGTPYEIGLGFGNGTQGSLTTRYLTTGTATIGYNLYKDADRKEPWGIADPNDTKGTGNGDEQPFTVYGRIPAQTTPAAGSYTDTVAISVAY